MKVLFHGQHSVCKVEGHHSDDGFDSNPNMLCWVESSCEVSSRGWPPSPRLLCSVILVLLAFADLQRQFLSQTVFPRSDRTLVAVYLISPVAESTSEAGEQGQYTKTY